MRAWAPAAVRAARSEASGVSAVTHCDPACHEPNRIPLSSIELARAPRQKFDINALTVKKLTVAGNTSVRLLKHLRRLRLRHGACTVPLPWILSPPWQPAAFAPAWSRSSCWPTTSPTRSTGGYKADREFYSLYSAAEAQDDPLSTMPRDRAALDRSLPGGVHPTGNPLDVALSGKGFFAVNGPSGPLYTRNGNFRLAADGKLVTGDGYPVRGADGTPVTLQSGRAVEIAQDGTVRQDGQVDRASSTSPISPAPPGSPSRATTTFASPIRPSARRTPAGTAVEQGKLEAPTPAARKRPSGWSA